MVNFCTKVKSITFHVKQLWLLFGDLRKNLDFFLIQHLVTLIVVDVQSIDWERCRVCVVSWRGRKKIMRFFFLLLANKHLQTSSQRYNPYILSQTLSKIFVANLGQIYFNFNFPLNFTIRWQIQLTRSIILNKLNESWKKWRCYAWVHQGAHSRLWVQRTYVLSQVWYQLANQAHPIVANFIGVAAIVKNNLWRAYDWLIFDK